MCDAKGFAHWFPSFLAFKNLSKSALLPGANFSDTFGTPHALLEDEPKELRAPALQSENSDKILGRIETGDAGASLPGRLIQR
jgi:hypothetical protein